jgi:hypothetical protein
MKYDYEVTYRVKGTVDIDDDIPIRYLENEIEQAAADVFQSEAEVEDIDYWESDSEDIENDM